MFALFDRRLAAVLLGSTLLVPAQALDILLTNDDGWQAPGIQQLYKTLTAAGHDVTIVAPLEQQSGQGGAMSTQIGGYIAVERQGDQMWSVASTPADAVRAGLDVIMKDTPPDLVISGANFGQNLSRTGAHQSGTINAALQGLFRGIPAIAISVGVRFDEHNAEPHPFPSTFAAFEPTAQLLTKLLEQLEAAEPAAILPPGVALNINVPVPFDPGKGMRLAPLSAAGNVEMHWQVGDKPFDAGGGMLQIMVAPVPASAAVPGDDVDLFNRGYVTVTPIDGSADVWVPVPGLAPSLGVPLLQK